ncbi:ATP-dependent RNA helicase DBP3 [Linum perenne]
MAKGDDALARKKNKSLRKKQQKDTSSSAVSARVASIIAAKKRRLSGKRRQCQGMCFSLPTLEDPFNDKLGKPDFPKKDVKSKKTLSSKRQDRKALKGNSAASDEEALGDSDGNLGLHKRRRLSKKHENTKNHLEKDAGKLRHQPHAFGNFDRPSKFLLLCLNAIESALRLEGLYGKEEDKPLFVDPWGVEFLKCFSGGKDILDTGGSSCTIEQIAWIVSIAADSFARKEKEGVSFTSPFLLFLVSSQEKAMQSGGTRDRRLKRKPNLFLLIIPPKLHQVRTVCKPLKSLGVHTVSLHPGASLEHQINGLKSCEPEFLVSTPERLLELVSAKAINISDVSFLVVDGLESLCKAGSVDALSSIRQAISGSSSVMVFNSHNSVHALQKILPGPVSRLSLDQSIHHQSVCIAQNINVCPYTPEKLVKGIQLLHGSCNQSSSVLYIVRKDKFHNFVKVLKLSGFFVSTGSDSDVTDMKHSLNSNGKKKPTVSVIHTDEIGTTDLSSYEIIVLPTFVLSIDKYIQILTKMARHTAHGVLHSFLTQEDAILAGPLIEILEKCGQPVPEPLKVLYLSSP